MSDVKVDVPPNRNEQHPCDVDRKQRFVRHHLVESDEFDRARGLSHQPGGWDARTTSTTWQSAWGTWTASALVLSLSEGSPNSYPAPSRMLHERPSRHTVQCNEHRSKPLLARPQLTKPLPTLLGYHVVFCWLRSTFCKVAQRET
jgi:hypothetical protein